MKSRQFTAGRFPCEGTCRPPRRDESHGLELGSARASSFTSDSTVAQRARPPGAEGATEKRLVCTKAEAWQPTGTPPPGISIWWSSKRVALGGDPALDPGLFSETICPTWPGAASGATRGSPGKRCWRERLFGTPPA